MARFNDLAQTNKIHQKRGRMGRSNIPDRVEHKFDQQRRERNPTKKRGTRRSITPLLATKRSERS